MIKNAYIYEIFCKVTKKRYIGSTTRPKERKREHFRRLKNNNHHSIKLQRAYNKYKVINFSFNIIEKFSEEVNEKLLEKICDREKYWVKFYDSYKKGYNSSNIIVCPFGKFNGMFGKAPKSKGVPSQNRKIIYSYNIETGEVKKYDFLLQVEKEGLSSGQVCDNANKKHKYCKGRFWFWEQDFSLNELKNRFLNYFLPPKNKGIKRPKSVCSAISKGRMGMKFTKKHANNISLTRIKMGIGRIKIIRNDGKVYDSIKEAAKDIEVDQSQISHFINGRGKSVAGYTFKKVE